METAGALAANIKTAIEFITTMFELLGVFVILGGAALCVPAAWRVRGTKGAGYTAVRATFGRGVLLGLEVLVAADIVRTVAVAPTLANLAVLASLVVIRTFLSWSFEVEIEGKWPWQRSAEEPGAPVP